MAEKPENICSNCLPRNLAAFATAVGKDVFKVWEVTFCKGGL